MVEITSPSGILTTFVFGGFSSLARCFIFSSIHSNHPLHHLISSRRTVEQHFQFRPGLVISSSFTFPVLVLDSKSVSVRTMMIWQSVTSRWGSYPVVSPHPTLLLLLLLLPFVFHNKFVAQNGMLSMINVLSGDGSWFSYLLNWMQESKEEIPPSF